MALTWRGEWGRAPCTRGRPKKDKKAFKRPMIIRSQWYAEPFFSLVGVVRGRVVCILSDKSVGFQNGGGWVQEWQKSGKFKCYKELI